jgi:hydroxypyruvate isomerase
VAGATAAMVGYHGESPVRAAAPENEAAWKVQKDLIHSSICSWCYKPLTFDDLCRGANAMGLRSVELLAPNDLPKLKPFGLTCAMVSSHPLIKGLNHVEHHAECIEKLTKSIDAAAEHGCPNVITFSGNRKGISDDDGIKIMAEGVKKIVGYAEQKKVTICIEVLNSRVDIENKGHPDYQADKIEWAVEVCKQVGSDRFKILFDIYHVQIMQGDIIARIGKFKDYIGHYHTAGVPGRNELDETQELNYPPIMQAILSTGYKGFVGQEFIPKGADKMAALRQAVKLCDV